LFFSFLPQLLLQRLYSAMLKAQSILFREFNIVNLINNLSFPKTKKAIRVNPLK